MDIDDSKTDPDPRLDDLGDDSKITKELKPTYKSWKKKYRKMRMVYDQKVFESEELHKRELQAIEACKRIAIENDRILDMLLDINSSGQIPLDKRIDLSVESRNDSDNCASTHPLRPSESLRGLESSIPHIKYQEAAKAGMLDDIEHPSTLPNADPDARPPSFLSADDIDNYIFEIDSRIGGPGSSLPTLAPLAHHGRRAVEVTAGTTTVPMTNGTNGHTSNSAHGAPITAPASSSSSYQLRNPASVYNWLRRHCPQVFLQDAEKDPKDETQSEKVVAKTKTPAARGGGSRASKRASTKAGPRANSVDKEMDEDDGTPIPTVTTTTTTTTARGKRKRAAEDDTGYRPKGGSSRPTKKKRKSEGALVTETPTVKRSRKSKKDLSEEIVKDVDMDADGVGNE